MSEAGALSRLERTAEAMAGLLRGLPGAVERPVPDHLALAQQAGTLRRQARWTNVLIETGALSHAHVEYFEIAAQLAVLHVCVFHRAAIAAPIYGFDVIAGAEKVTGAFLDLSPAGAETDVAVAAWAEAFAAQRARFGRPRTLPEWGDIFSPNAVAVRPQNEAEIEAALDLGAASLRWLLARPFPKALSPSAVAAGQQRYIVGQRRNEHTLRVLAGVVGPDLARAFVERWLFPDVTTGPARARGFTPPPP